MTLGDRIRVKREQARLTQEELAVKTGTKKQTISKYENGIITDIPLSKLDTIAKALNTTPIYLLGWEDFSIKTSSEKQKRYNFMDLEKWKQVKKEKHLSYDDLAAMTGYSRSTITNIFCGYIEYPRFETIQAIEHALGIDKPQPLSSEQQELFSLIQSLSDDEAKQLNDYLSFLLSKRK